MALFSFEVATISMVFVICFVLSTDLIRRLTSLALCTSRYPRFQRSETPLPGGAPGPVSQPIT